MAEKNEIGIESQEKHRDKMAKTEGSNNLVDSQCASIGEGHVVNAFVPDEDDDLIDPRLKDYPVPLVAKTVPLHNDPSEHILTFRFWVLAGFWVSLGCVISTFYYFKPYSTTLSTVTVQLLSWWTGNSLARWLPTKRFTTFGYEWTLNPGPWNTKEHALIVVAVWGSQHTAYGLGPLTALELYYGHKINAGAIMFLLSTQLIGYGFVGIFRDIVVRPPKIFYPVVLPNVALLNAMHKNPALTSRSLRYFAIVTICAFCWAWFPSLIWPMLGSLPLLCYIGHGNWIAYILGSGSQGFGILNITLDWNYASFFSPLYTPLWSTASQVAGAVFACWILYPILYFLNINNSMKFPAMSSSTFDSTGTSFNVSRVLTADGRGNFTALHDYSLPYWSTSYAMYFFWGFASSAGAILFALLWYGNESWSALRQLFRGRRAAYDDDPYIQATKNFSRVPHWWYLVLLVISTGLALASLYGGGWGLPWWGFLVITMVSLVFTFPSGILFGTANIQVGMSFFSELIAGALFPGQPKAVLATLVFGRQVLDQTLNLCSDYKFGFYMKIPEKELFVAQIYGTLLGPFINYGVMRLIIDGIGVETLTGAKSSASWLALKSRNFYSTYAYIFWGFLVGPLLVLTAYGVQRWRPTWNLEHYCNPVVMMFGATWFPVYGTTNLMTSAIVAFVFMGYIQRYHGAWFRKYNYLTGVGLDCGTQIMLTIMVFTISLTNTEFPVWWGNSAVTDRCFPPSTLPQAMQ
ncbi:oligopeptide transporter 6 [Fusarium proliferatum]|uniref:Oligopeptide transporter 6 n=1 Tax=Gibberella intermedia TaxID=948311 RepID=A0A365MTC2_GIBIN|nr:oligopeptide transporter 6 [Fusarium proliferatum]